MPENGTDLKAERENGTSEARRSRRALALFVSTAAILFALAAALVIVVDPFFHYHAPLPGFPYVVDNQLAQNPGMARNMIYDSCIVGSSMTVNFDTDDFAELLDLRTIKLSYSGAMPHDDYNILSIVYETDSLARRTEPLKAVFMSVDAVTYTAGLEETKYPLPEYLYDHNPWNDIRYVLNKDVLLQYVLRPMINRSPTDLSEVYHSWWTPEYYNIQWVMHTYAPVEQAADALPADAFAEGTAANLEANILPFIEAHPETTFYMFFPPYSILYWNDVVRGNHLDATLAQISLLAERLSAYDNVRVFYFQDMEDVITDLNNYADMSHFKPEINRYMVECFADGTRELDAGEIGGRLAHLREIIETFDFEALFAQDW